MKKKVSTARGHSPQSSLLSLICCQASSRAGAAASDSSTCPAAGQQAACTAGSRRSRRSRQKDTRCPKARNGQVEEVSLYIRGSTRPPVKPVEFDLFWASSRGAFGGGGDELQAAAATAAGNPTTYVTTSGTDNKCMRKCCTSTTFCSTRPHPRRWAPRWQWLCTAQASPPARRQR